MRTDNLGKAKMAGWNGSPAKAGRTGLREYGQTAFFKSGGSTPDGQLCFFRLGPHVWRHLKPVFFHIFHGARLAIAMAEGRT